MPPHPSPRPIALRGAIPRPPRLARRPAGRRLDPRTAAIAALAGTLAAAPPARADCIDEAAARHGVNAAVLRAIGWQESRLRPAALGRNANGSVDLGAFQINSAHLVELARLGVPALALSDGCINADVAAWHYRRQVDRLGNTWAAVGAYHSPTPWRAARYANGVAAVLATWHLLPPGTRPFPDPLPRRDMASDVAHASGIAAPNLPATGPTR